MCAILLGGFFIAYGEYDDSPGGQVLGVMAIILGIVGIFRSWKKNSF